MVSIGLYSKQLIFFLALAAVAGGGLWYVRGQSLEAAPARVNLPNTSVATLTIDVADGGIVTVNGERLDNLIEFGRATDTISYQAFEADGSFVDQLITTLTLPRSMATNQVIARHAATPGVVAQEPTVANRSVTYIAYGLTPQAAYHLELVLPKGIVKPALWRRGVDGLRNLTPGTWLAVALGLPTLATAILLVLFHQALRTWRGPRITEQRDTPPLDSSSTAFGVSARGKPSGLSPAVATVLVTGKVSPRSLAATLLDLARHGYVQVVHRSDGFSFGKRRPLDLASRQVGSTTANDLKPFERLILGKIFSPKSLRSRDSDIQLRIGQHIFSRQIAESYLRMYEAAVAQGWFVRSPELLYRRYQTLALLVISAAVLGFVLSLLVGPQPYFYLLGWAGLFFVGVVMQRLIPFLPRRTARGDRDYREWIKFRNYLASREPVAGNRNPQQLYEQYLPYAVGFGVEVEWTERFLDLPFNPPDWYSSTESIHVVEEFANSLFPIIGSVAYDFAKAREPYAV